MSLRELIKLSQISPISFFPEIATKAIQSFVNGVFYAVDVVIVIAVAVAVILVARPKKK